MSIRQETSLSIPRRIPLVLTAAICLSAVAAETMPTRLYEVTTETGMPHLEENFRYTTQRERLCLAHQPLSAGFPILDHPALRGCRLRNEVRQAESVTYTLVCEGGHGTTGQAVWHLDEHRIRGTLDIKLGGKNMTFYQRVTAVPLGRCTAAREQSSREHHVTER